MLPSLRSRLRREFLRVAVWPVLGLLGAVSVAMLSGLVTQAESRNAELAVIVREQAELQMTLRRHEAAALADSIPVHGARPERLGRALAALLARDRFMQAIFVLDAEGRVMDAALPPDSGRFREDMLGLDLSRQAHVRAAREGQAPMWSDTFLSTLTGEITVGLAYPQGEHTVVFELSLRTLSNSLLEMSKQGNTQVFVFDRAGRVVANNDPRFAAQQQSLADLPSVQGALKGESRGGWWRGPAGLEIAHALPVPAIGWGVLVSISGTEVLAPFRFVLGATFVVLLLSVALAAWSANRLSAQHAGEVLRLAEVAERVVAEQGPPVAMRFSVAEYEAIWHRLHDLIRELQRSDGEARAARADLQAVLDAATEVAIVATDEKGLITVFSQGARQLLGWHPEEVLWLRSPLDWHADLPTAPADAAGAQGAFEAWVATARRDGHDVQPRVFCRRDGSQVQVTEALSVMRSPDGALKGYLSVAIDTSHQQRAAALEVAHRAAEAASQAKTAFLGRMSHELRTPLNAILGFAELLEEREVQRGDTVELAQLRHIQTAGWHLVRLIDEVLDMSKIEAGMLKLSLEPVALRALAEAAEKMVQGLLQTHGIRLDLDLPPEGTEPVEVQADPTRLLQVLLNLLSNAIKYNRPQGEVTLRVAREGDAVLIDVVDTGQGMTPDQLAHLFEPFNRLGRESSGTEGSGIGLALSRRLVELMGGRVQVDSVFGQGSRFRLRFPATEAQAR